MAVLPDVAPGQRITAQHINAIKNSVYTWLGSVDAQGFSLGNAGAAEFASVAAYVNTDGVGVRIREYGRAGAQASALDKSPRLGFFWQGVGAAQIGLDAAGLIRTFNQAGNGYAGFVAATGDFAAPVADAASPGVVIRAALRNSTGPISAVSTPKLMFYWTGVGYSQIGMDTADPGGIRTYMGSGAGADHAGFACGPLRAQINFAMNIDAAGKYTKAGPACIWQADATSGGRIYLGFALNGVIGASVSWHSFPVNISADSCGFGAPQILKAQIDSPYFYPKKIVQPDWAYQAWNLEDSSGQWRHIAAGYGNVLTSSVGDGGLRVWASLNGAAGAVASLKAVAAFSQSGVMVDPLLYFPNAVGEKVRLFSGPPGPGFSIGVESAAMWLSTNVASAFRWYQGVAPDGGAGAAMELTSSGVLRLKNQNGERIRVYDSGGINHAIGVEPSCMYQQVAAGSVFRWYVGAAPDNGVSYNMQLEPAHMRLQASTEMDLDFICYAGGTNAKLSRITAAPGSIAFQLLNDTYTAGISSFSLYATYCAASVPIVNKANTATSDTALVSPGEWYAYAPTNTQLVFRMRGGDGVVRQATLTLA